MYVFMLIYVSYTSRIRGPVSPIVVAGTPGESAAHRRKGKRNGTEESITKRNRTKEGEERKKERKKESHASVAWPKAYCCRKEWTNE